MDQPLVFLSHAGADAAPAKELADGLRRAGLRVWLDSESLRPGDLWQQEIERAVEAADHFVVLVGRLGVQYWVDRETRLALVRNTRQPAFRIVPVLGPGADPDGLPGFLSQHQHQRLDLREKRLDDPEKLQQLVAALSGREPAAVSLLPPNEAPFLGLRAFHDEDAHLFFGRDREVGELIERLQRSPFLVVVGASGTGKSSLVRAGLIPALRRGRFHDGKSWVEDWRVAVLRPADAPFRELVNQLPELDPDLSPAERDEFLDHRRKSIENDGALYNSIVSLVPAGARTLLVVDQFEELLTGLTPEDVRERFLNALLHAAAQSGGDRPVHVVLTVRADFLHFCWRHPGLFEQVQRNLYPVGHLGPEQLRQTIERPLALAGSEPETGLVEAILADAQALAGPSEAHEATRTPAPRSAAEPARERERRLQLRNAGTLPLLEHALLRLWETGRGKLTHKAYDGIRRLAGAIEDHADRVYRELSGDHRQSLVKRMFLRLIQPGEEQEATRRRATRRELIDLAETRTDGERVLDRLVEARLLVAHGGDSETDQPIEIAHEALIRGWTQLDGWVRENRGFLLWRKSLQAMIENDAPLAGRLLVDAREWARKRDKDLSAEEREYIARSVRDRAKRLAGGIAAVVVAIGLAVAAFWFGTRTSDWSRLRDNLSNKGYAAAWDLLARTKFARSDPARLRAVVKETETEVAAFFEQGDIADARTRDVSEAVLDVAGALLPTIESRAIDSETVAAVAWSLDYYPGRDEELAARARILRERLLEPLKKRRPPPPSGTLEWVDLPAGEFEMGSPEGDGSSDERPRHRVLVSAFRMLAHEVTVGEYGRFAPDQQKATRDESLPVVNVSWYDAYAYAAWLGPGCRLPTEAEWEYAARKDCAYDYCDRNGNKTTLDEVGRYDENSDGHLWPAKSREPSPVGLYDMYGNAWEWVADWYGAYSPEPQTDPWGPPRATSEGFFSDSRVLRGGSWDRLEVFARAASRYNFTPGYRYDDIGFRVVCSSPISL